jgi:hypothetical protein
MTERILDDVRSTVSTSLDQRRALINETARQTAEIATHLKAAQLAASAGNATTANAEAAKADALRKSRAKLSERMTGIDKQIRDQIDRLRVVDPCDCEADVPLALFPVRLETRFGAQGGILRVRIYPDDIHVDQLDRGLSDEEQAAGRAYWTAVWTADADGAANAWSNLTNQVHTDRAGWVAAALTPNNVADAGPSSIPDFPIVGPRTKRAAVARMLPDRFVGVVVQGDQRVLLTGAPIPPEVVVGMLADDGSAMTTTPAGIQVLAGAEWLADYDQAVKVGLGITFQLPRPNQPIDQLFVVGVRSTLNPDQTRAAVEDQLRGHLYTRGLGIIPQGTPTNNTETDRADWQSSVAPTPPAQGAPTAPASGSNAAVVAGALGVDPQLLANVEHGGETEQPLAHAMNVALWSPSWGGLLDRVTTISMDKKTLSDATREQTRGFFRDFVRGRGPVPAIRVGNQPYGILPVSATDTLWKAGNDAFTAGLLDLLRRLRIKWRQSLDNVPRMDRANAPVDATLLEILGSTAVLQSLRVRTVIDGPLSDFAAQATGQSRDAAALEKMIEQVVLEELSLLSFAQVAASLEKQSRPLPLALVDTTDPTFIEHLLNGHVDAVASVFRALLALSWSAAQDAIAQQAPPKAIGSLVAKATALPVNVQEQVRSLAFRADQASAAELHAGADLVAAHVGESGALVLAQHAPIAGLRPSLGDLALSAVSDAAAVQLSPIALGGWLRAQAKLAELKAALKDLHDMPNDLAGIESRRILVAETLDLASHRLDAWITGIVEQRRTVLRAQRPLGLMVGAYGWVENLAPQNSVQRNGGFIHAPSTAHAVTAGLLRSAYLTHNPDKSGSGAFAVDLSSARVRLAIDLLDGMRQGQSLGALLGYRVERAMHEARLDKFLLSLRAVAPLVDGQLTTHDETVPQQAVEAVSANNVVDGAKLIDIYQKDPKTIFAALAAKPANNPFLTGWDPPTPDEEKSIRAAIESAISASDAVADLLLAESVHQLAQGNMARSAAALDSAGSGEAQPVEPTVVQSPAQGVRFTHRLMIAVTGDGAAWSTSRPRAKAAPRLENWAGTRLGAPSQVVVHVSAGGVRTMLDSSGLAALDLIYESVDSARVERSIRAALPAIPAGDALTSKRDPAWPAGLRSVHEVIELAGSLHGVLAQARPAIPADFAGPDDIPARPPRVIDTTDLSGLKTRAQSAQGALAAAANDVQTQLPAPAGAPIDVAALTAALQNLAGYGIATPSATGDTLITVAELALAEAQRRVATASALLLGSFDAKAATDVGQALFGAGFWMLPLISPPPGGDPLTLAIAAGTVTPPAGAIRRFLRDTASVRGAVARYTETLLLGDAIDRRPKLAVGQIADPSDAPTLRWAGGTFDLAVPSPQRPVTDIVFESPSSYLGGATAALVIDGWVDIVPLRRKRGTSGAEVIDERITSGLAVNAAAAAARPPQSILLAVSPDGARWTADRIVATLSDTLELAKIRAVTLERTNGIARLLPALYEQSWSLQGEKVIDFSQLKVNPDMTALSPFVKDAHL